MTPADNGTTLTETWEFLPDGIAMFGEKYGDEADAQIADRTQQALDGIPKNTRGDQADRRIQRSNRTCPALGQEMPGEGATLFRARAPAVVSWA
ncbi:hypothetical protein [Arthrobacter sp. SLBN-83]|uniref:hypothetical protein n=1 Tax=Arthrobacter sp. SLBN-83 TaxID=2768449 RepID=UPI001F3255BD|nr:hypothetical protein [Arthrobacter sp. SLBN-83]